MPFADNNKAIMLIIYHIGFFEFGADKFYIFFYLSVQ